LEGKLVDKEGPVAGLEVKAGEVVWRESGSRHVAWTPGGGLMLAMVQIPNKFYERDGRVTDVSGQDWETVSGHALQHSGANSSCRSSRRENARQSVTATRLRGRCYNAGAWPGGGTVDTADLKSASGKPECRFESGRGHHYENMPRLTLDFRFALVSTEFSP